MKGGFIFDKMKVKFNDVRNLVNIINWQRNIWHNI
jgi:hypothetical protein